MFGTGLLLLTALLAGSTSWGLKPDTEDPRLAKALHQECAIREAQRAIQLHSQDRLAEAFDFKRYDLDLEIVPDDALLTGSVHMLAEVVAPAETLCLNMNSTWLYPDSVKGPVIAYSHANDQLKLLLDRQFQHGEHVDVTVYYHGSPQYTSWNLPFFFQYDGHWLITTLSQPYAARNWWPCKDQPDDKADSVSISVTVPESLVVASNGRLESVEYLSGNRARYNWLETYPIVTYLVSLAIAQYELVVEWYVSAEGDSVPVHHYVVEADWADEFAAVIPAMGIFADLFGPYPFEREKYGHALFPWDGGMEHQTCTSIGWFPDYSGWNDILVHELAHMWWGDMVTCETWHHIWLNEGFAVYSEALWHEAIGGEEAYHDKISDERYLGPGTIYVEDPLNDNIFDYGLTYQKAGYVLHMLRHVVGEQFFFGGLMNYRQTHEYSTAVTDDFRDCIEDLGWGDLDWFFDQWIYSPYYPQYEYGWVCEEGAGADWLTTLVIRQIQTNTGLFIMPVDVALELADGTFETWVVWAESLEDSLALVTERQVIGVEIDPEDWILCEKNEISLGVADPMLKVEVPTIENLWPNPAQSTAILTIRTKDRTRLSLYDLAGRVHAVQAITAGQRQAVLELGARGILPGVYVVGVANSAGQAERTLIVKP